MHKKIEIILCGLEGKLYLCMPFVKNGVNLLSKGSVWIAIL